MKLYVLGFVASLILTLGAYGAGSLVLIGALALLQIGIQFVCFLRLGQEPEGEIVDPWNMSFFLFTVLIAFVVVVGSLWIMYNLNYRM